MRGVRVPRLGDPHQLWLKIYIFQFNARMRGSGDSCCHRVCLRRGCDFAERLLRCSLRRVGHVSCDPGRGGSALGPRGWARAGPAKATKQLRRARLATEVLYISTEQVQKLATRTEDTRVVRCAHLAHDVQEVVCGVATLLLSMWCGLLGLLPLLLFSMLLSLLRFRQIGEAVSFDVSPLHRAGTGSHAKTSGQVDGPLHARKHGIAGSGRERMRARDQLLLPFVPQGAHDEDQDVSNKDSKVDKVEFSFEYEFEYEFDEDPQPEPPQAVPTSCRTVPVRGLQSGQR
jgi:hypothetical protein